MNTPCASLFDWTSPPGSKDDHLLFEKFLLELSYPTKATIFGKLSRCSVWLDKCAKEDNSKTLDNSKMLSNHFFLHKIYIIAG